MIAILIFDAFGRRLDAPLLGAQQPKRPANQVRIYPPEAFKAVKADILASFDGFNGPELATKHSLQALTVKRVIAEAKKDGFAGPAHRNQPA